MPCPGRPQNCAARGQDLFWVSRASDSGHRFLRPSGEGGGEPLVLVMITLSTHFHPSWPLSSSPFPPAPERHLTAESLQEAGGGRAPALQRLSVRLRTLRQEAALPSILPAGSFTAGAITPLLPPSGKVLSESPASPLEDPPLRHPPLGSGSFSSCRQKAAAFLPKDVPLVHIKSHMLHPIPRIPSCKTTPQLVLTIISLWGAAESLEAFQLSLQLLQIHKAALFRPWLRGSQHPHRNL